MAETPPERLNRELIELLNELRVALPGVQVLFGFLLAMPFTQRFHRLGSFDRALYFAALLAAAVASALLIAPSSYHRIRFRERDKERLIRIGNRLVILGTAFLAVSISLALFLIADVLYGVWHGVVTAALAGALFGWLWYGLPLSRQAGRGAS